MPDSADFLPTSCELCPRRCRANRQAGERGVCGASDELLLARAALHLWEEPLLCTGAGSGAIFFSGCPLRCCYCQNSDISLTARGAAISVERLAQIMVELQEQGACNINVVTPTHYSCWISPALSIARSRGLRLPLVYNTSGYELPEVVRSLDAAVDVYLTDFKYAPESVSDAARAYSHAPDYFECAIASLDAMVSQVGEPRVEVLDSGEQSLVRGVVIRHLLLPGRLADSKWVLRYLWERYGNSVLYSIMNQYTPLRSFPNHPELDHRVSAEVYEELLDYADSIGLEDYYWQEGDPARESFIPAWNLEGVLP